MRINAAGSIQPLPVGGAEGQVREAAAQPDRGGPDSKAQRYQPDPCHAARGPGQEQGTRGDQANYFVHRVFPRKVVAHSRGTGCYWRKRT